MAMTEIDFSRDQCPDIKRITLDASDSDKATQINVPSWVRILTVRPYSANVRLSFTTASDDINTDYVECTADSPTEFTWWSGYNQDNGISKLYIANLTGETSTVISVIVEGTDK